MTKKTIMNFADGPKEVEVGDTIYEVSNQHNGGGMGERTITAIGRQYISSQIGRTINKYCMLTGRLKTEYQGSTAWSSKDAYDEHINAIKNKKSFIEMITEHECNSSAFWLNQSDTFSKNCNVKKG
jgi:hypothetical protein